MGCRDSGQNVFNCAWKYVMFWERGAITLLPRGGNAEAWKPGLTWILVF